MNTVNESTDILIFRTSIATHNDVNAVASGLNSDDRIVRWTVDVQDVDHVLRIESINLPTAQVVDRVRAAGFHCEELDY